MTERFAAAWLTDREPFDAAARNLAVARRLAAVLPARPRLLDLGAGTFSLLRWLAPIINRPQVWTPVDADAELIERGFARTALWAERQGLTVTFPGKAMIVHTRSGAWRLEALRADLRAAPRGLPLDRADAVVCSALLDLVSAAWLDRLAAAVRVPVYAALSVDGRESWAPHHAADGLIRAGFRRDQTRDKGFGPALGARAPGAFAHAFGRRGFHIVSAAADWRVRRADTGMARDLIHGHADAAFVDAPFLGVRLNVWRHARLRQAAREALAIRIGHRDSLALPRGD